VLGDFGLDGLAASRCGASAHLNSVAVRETRQLLTSRRGADAEAVLDRRSGAASFEVSSDGVGSTSSERLGEWLAAESGGREL
jgi:hypothetical protein